MTIIFAPASLGPEMAAPLYGRLAYFGSFWWKIPMLIKFLIFGGGGSVWKGGWKCQFYFYGRGIHLIKATLESHDSNRTILNRPILNFRITDSVPLSLAVVTLALRDCLASVPLRPERGSTLLCVGFQLLPANESAVSFAYPLIFFQAQLVGTLQY